MRNIVVTIFGILNLCIAAEIEPLQYEAFRKILEDENVAQEKREQFFEELETYDTTGNVTGLRQFLLDEQDVLILASGAALSIEEPASTRKTIHQKLRNHKNPPNALFTVGALVASRKTIDLFIRKWNTGEFRDERAISSALASATGQSHPNNDEWANWWKENRKDYERKKIRSYDEAFRRIRTGLQANMVEVFSAISRKFDEEKNPNSNPFASIGNMFRLGNEIEGDATQKGDRFFISSEYERAYEWYQKAITENPEDHKSRFFLGCIDFELQRYEMAKTHFDSVAKKEDAYVAEYLALLVARRIEKPDEPLSTAAILTLKNKSVVQEFSGPGDLVMARISGQSAVGKGIYSVGIESLHHIIADHPNNAMMTAGAVLLIPQRERVPFLEALGEKFPESPMIQYIVISGLIGDIEKKDLVLQCAKNWIKVEPDNFLPVYFQSYAKHFAVQRNTDNPATVPDNVWDHLIIASKDLKPNPHHVQMIEAQKQVLSYLENPFHCNITLSNAGTSLIYLAQASKIRIEKLAETDREKARETLRVIETLTDIQGPAVAQTINRICLSIARKPLLSEEEMAEVKKQRLSTSDLSLRMMTISNLPIPSLQKELLEQYWSDPVHYCEGMGFF